MKKRLFMTMAAAVLTLAPMTMAEVTNLPSIQAIQEQGQQLVALGGSLDSAQAQQTLQLLGASQVPQSNIIYVDGTMINRYLQDGSGPGTIVYSSAYIQQMPEGHGVQVQIVTPQNIQLVTPLTYQNAAITAGARNAQIRIATVNPVTGEGALAGVYALLEQQGVTLNQQDINVAQQEIQVVQNIQDTTQTSNQNANQVLADVKTQVTQQIVNQIESGGDVNISQDQVNNIVVNVTQELNINDPALIEQLVQFALEYSKTQAAQNEDTVEQLEQSISANWLDVLAEIDGGMAPEEILAGERLDYSDVDLYHPIFQEFANTIYQAVESNESIDHVYNDTFIYEMVTPEISAEEKVALNELRSLMYHYQVHYLESTIPALADAGSDYVRQTWTARINAFNDLKMSDPAMAEMIQQLAVTGGRAPQVYDYMNPSQEGTVVSFENVFNHYDHTSDFTNYSYDVVTGQMQELDVVSNAMVDLMPAYLGDKYGVTVDYHYIPQTIPADYMIPGYVPEESIEETTEEVETISEEETIIEEVPEESEEVIEDQPGEEEVIEESSDNTVIE